MVLNGAFVKVIFEAWLCLTDIYNELSRLTLQSPRFNSVYISFSPDSDCRREEKDIDFDKLDVRFFESPNMFTRKYLYF